MRWTLALASLSLLTLAPAVFADHRYDPWDEVQVTAHRLEEAARHVHRQAERLAHHGGYREERSLVALHRLEERADHFHRQVEARRSDPWHTEGDYRALRQAYADAAASLRYAHAFEHVDRDFAEVGRLMRRLAAAYEPLVYRTYDHRGRGDGRYRDDDRYRGRGAAATRPWFELLFELVR